MELTAALRPLPYVHPMLVHFPVVFLLAAAALDALALVSGRKHLAATARRSLWAGTLAAAFAVWSGHESAEALESPVGSDARALIMLHHDWAVAVLVGAVVLSVSLRGHRRLARCGRVRRRAPHSPAEVARIRARPRHPCRCELMVSRRLRRPASRW